MLSIHEDNSIRQKFLDILHFTSKEAHCFLGDSVEHTKENRRNLRNTRQAADVRHCHTPATVRRRGSEEAVRGGQSQVRKPVQGNGVRFKPSSRDPSCIVSSWFINIGRMLHGTQNAWKSTRLLARSRNRRGWCSLLEMPPTWRNSWNTYKHKVETICD